MNKLVELFCGVDYFCKVFIPQWKKQLLEDGTQKCQRSMNGFMLNLLTGFVAYCLKKDKPNLKISRHKLEFTFSSHDLDL